MKRSKFLRRVEPTEADISKVIKDRLEIWVAQGKVRYFRAHPVRLVTRKGKTFPAPVEESQKGSPDFFVFTPFRYWWIETKRPGEKLRPAQESWAQFTDRYWKIDSVKDAELFLSSVTIAIENGL